MQQVEFKGIPTYAVFEKNNREYKIYAVKPNGGDTVEFNSYGSVTVKGNMQSLVLNNEYYIKARKTNDNKHGVAYEVSNIYMAKPETKEDVRNFLENLLTKMQADTIMENYPNIIELVVDDRINEIDTDNLYNIAEKRLNVITRKIRENFKYMELTMALEDYELKHDYIVRLHSEFGSVKKVLDAMKNNPYNVLCNKCGISFQYADEKICNADFNMAVSKVRLIEAIEHIIARCSSNGDSIVPEKRLIQQLDSIDPLLYEIWYDYNNDLGEDIIFTDYGVTTKRIYNMEMYIYNKLSSANDNSRGWGVNVEEYRDLDEDIRLTDEQMTSLRKLCYNNFSILTAGAGQGKSTATKAMTNYLNDNGFTFWLGAPTGRASEVLSEKTNEKASTIHRMLKYNPRTGYGLDYVRADVVILDEVSMVDIELMYEFLRRVDFNRTKVVFVADPAQLPSVGVGNVLHDLLQMNKFPTTQLTKVFRYSEGGLAKIATDTRANNKWLSQNENEVKVFGNNKDYIFYPYDKDKGLEKLYEIYMHMISNNPIEDVMVLTSYKVGDYGTHIINEVLRELYNPIDDNKKEISTKYKSFRVGDRIMQTKNNYDAMVIDYENIDFEWLTEDEFEDEIEEGEIFNGKLGTVVDIFEGYLIVEFDNKVVVYHNTDFNNIILGYAITVHKSQGSEMNNCIFFTPSSHSYLLNRNLIYTGITRAKERVVHIGSPYTVYNAMDKSAQEDRMTNMRFIGENKEVG